MHIDYSDPLAAHRQLKGKLATRLKDTLDSQEKLSTYYTPGVAKVSKYLARNKDETRNYTSTNNSVAIVSDGSAVLGLGNIGPEGALPVMEGKAMLFKHFANIDATAIVLSTQDPEEIIKTTIAIAPSFGAINLEDIAAPKCFEIEEKIKLALDMPIMHDDQHGTAVVVLAALINALKVTDRNFDSLKIVMVGAGAAGTAVAKLLHLYTPKAEILMLDRRGVIAKHRSDLNKAKQNLLAFTNKNNVSGSLFDVINGADVFIGVSAPGILRRDHIRSMRQNPIIFAMANPDPEILPEEAKAAGAAVVATGRSDFPNQVNNALAFPGIFRGALDNRVAKITDEHKLKAAEVLANLVKKPTTDRIIPSVLDQNVVPAIAKVIV